MAEQAERENYVEFPVRLEASKRDRMRKLADAGYRSLQAELRMAVDEHLERHDTEQADAA